ncbi:DsrE family protein [Pareuzebyella sediminis]|uniref:DsrE family protein n=1 Tax=Pareuzebyella sediminis TaxID=2607998 RepID=UPI0011EFF112|nr:DsrE family protein [Pareuzebyella sediminis]
MKNMIIVLGICLMAFPLWAQQEPIKVVFDVTSGNSDVQRSAARHLRLMSETYPDSEFEMVIYSGAYEMVDNKSSAAGETLRKIIQNDNVSIVVCRNTMKRKNKTEADLIPGVTTVPDGIYEIVMRQQQGWGYIKEGK